MTIQQLDEIFPFIVFCYGLIIVFVLTNPKLLEMAEKRMPSPVWSQMAQKRPLGLICVVVGGLWSLQNLWLGVSF